MAKFDRQEINVCTLSTTTVEYSPGLLYITYYILTNIYSDFNTECNKVLKLVITESYAVHITNRTVAGHGGWPGGAEAVA